MIRNQFKVYGLNAILDLTEDSDNHDLIAAMKGHLLLSGQTFAICPR